MACRGSSSAKDLRVIERPGACMAVPASAQPATVAAARVSRAGAVLGAGGLASAGFVIWRLTETWRVTPAAASHRVSVLGQPLTYPAANLGAVVVVGLALVGLAVIAIAVSGAAHELAAERRLRRWLHAHATRRHAGALVIEDVRPRAFCAGLLRPRVYVSAGALELLDDAALRAVLAHEHAHARRRDPLRLACGRVLARALFCLPGLGELHRRQLALAELSADESAIAAEPGNRAALARAMLSFAEHSRPEDPTGLDPERVDHLLGDPPGWRFPLLVFLLGFGVLGLLAAVGVLAGRVAAGSATLAPPFLSRQPCVVMLAVIPVLVIVVALARGRRGPIRGRPGS
jgi:Zn-dependent protease with chaperone function